MYSKKSKCSRTEPCGTLDVTYVMSERAPLTETRCLRFDRKDVIQLCVLPVIPHEVSLEGVYVGLYQKLSQNLGEFNQFRHPVMDRLY